jgi:hypothetical protein
VSALDKLHQDTSRLAAAAESQAAAIAKLIPNVEWLQDRYVEKLDEIIRLRADLAAERAEVERLRAAGDALGRVHLLPLPTAEVCETMENLLINWKEARRAR